MIGLSIVPKLPNKSSTPCASNVSMNTFLPRIDNPPSKHSHHRLYRPAPTTSLRRHHDQRDAIATFHPNVIQLRSHAHHEQKTEPTRRPVYLCERLVQTRNESTKVEARRNVLV